MGDLSHSRPKRLVGFGCDRLRAEGWWTWHHYSDHRHFLPCATIWCESVAIHLWQLSSGTFLALVMRSAITSQTQYCVELVGGYGLVVRKQVEAPMEVRYFQGEDGVVNLIELCTAATTIG